ncbi:MAG: hypothetical protein HFI06_01370 [Eubacterium sp.]|jgi:hypothetical protein|nr:hypothetical protein [Eubacterium sp.]
MQTILTLRQLIRSIQLHPPIASSVPWDDILACLLAEYECCSCIYPATQYQTIQQTLSSIITDARQIPAKADAATTIDLLEKLVFALEFLPEAQHIDPLLNQANFDHACLNHNKNNTIIVLGDSHVNFFSGNEELTFLPIGHEVNTCPIQTVYPFTPLHVGPCLAYNCNRADTTLRFQEKVAWLCQNFICPHAKIICCLGEIDLRVHVFKQTKRQNKDYKQIVDDILTEYIRFLVSLSDQGYQIYCWGPIASQTQSCPLDPMFPRNGSEMERNQATAYFNLQLSALCQEHGIVFLSIFNNMITDEYQTLEQYLSADRCHLSQRALPLAKEEWKKHNLFIF